MTIGRDIIVQAFPGQPRMQAAFEGLVSDAEDLLNRLETAATTLAALETASGGIVDILAGKQDENQTLTAISFMPPDAGVLEQIQPGVVSIRPIDAADTKSLVTRELGDSRWLGQNHQAASSGKWATPRNLTGSGDVSWSLTAVDGTANVNAVTTLATVNSNTGTFGGATTSPQISVDGKGRITGVTAVTIAPLFSSIASKPTTLAGYGITDAQGLSALLTAYAGAAWSAGVQIPTLTAANTVALKTVGSATGNILDKAAGDALYLAIGGTAAAATKLATGRTIGITGDVTWTSPTFDGSSNVTAAATVTRINGVALSGLATGILKNTTTTGVPSIAVAADFPTLNQSTTGSAATLTTGRTISITGDLAYTSTAFDGSGAVTAAGTLATVNANTGAWGSATQVAQITLDGKGRATAAANVTITPAVGSITGLGTGVATFLATPSSANLATAITDETGSGALVFGTTPTLATPVINGLPTGTGVAATSTASALAARDANKNLLANNFLSDYTTTATAAGTTTLTVASTYLQFFTGVTTQTVTLPVASTLALGQQFQIVNLSTGAVTVNASGGAAVLVLAGGTAATVTCILTSGTTAASWSASYWADAVASGKKLTVSNSLTFTGTDGSSVAFGTGGTLAYLGTAETFTAKQTFAAGAGNTSLEVGSDGAFASVRIFANISTGAFNDGMYIGYQNSNSGVTRLFGGGSTTATAIVTATTFDVTGNITATGSSNSAGNQLITGTGAQGYGTGSGGTITQITSKATGVTLSKTNGQIVTSNAALAAATVVVFTVTNTTVAATDTVNLNLASGNVTAGTYRYWIDKVSAGSFVVAIENRSAGSLSEALTFNFAVVKAVTA